MNFEDYETLPTTNVTTHMVAGGIAGIMEHCVMYPLDSVKTRMQSLVVQQPGADSIRKTLWSMIRHEGILRPVRGMSAMVLGAGPSHALYFSSYEYLKNSLLTYTSNSSYHSLIYGFSGCLSTLIHDGIMNPAEVVKQRMQMMHSPYKSAANCFLDIYRREGARAFYRSYTTQLTMNIPYQSLHFIVYEMSQKFTNPTRDYNPRAHMVSGALAGGIAAAITTPLDVCKTLLNTQQGGATATGMVEAVRKVYHLRGFRGYFRGLHARVMYQMPATMICWSTYEFFKYVLNEQRHLTPNKNNRSETPIREISHTGTSNCAHSSNSNSGKNDTLGTTAALLSEKMNLKSRDLSPTMSASGLYSTISFNTMHTTNVNDGYHHNKGRNDTILDIVHT